MVHLGPLPGAPRFGGDFAAVVAAAVSDATKLEEAGFGAVMVENYGDAPFFADDVPKVTVAAMTAAVAAVTDAVGIPVGVNVLRNDALAAIAVTAATGADLVRVNVLSGSMFTDQGLIMGKAAEVARARKALAPEVRVLADVFVKHATPPAGLTITEAAGDLAGRGLADAVIVSGTATGVPVDLEVLGEVRHAIGSTPLFIGSGADSSNVSDLLNVADGVIVGTSLKEGSLTTAPVDPEKAARLVAAASR